MKTPLLAATWLLLCAVTTGAAGADDTARLPDMSQALEARIDTRMNDVLNGTSARSNVESRRATVATTRDAVRSPSAAPARPDGSSWKPYHSAM